MHRWRQQFGTRAWAIIALVATIGLGGSLATADALTASGPAGGEPLRILVTNDDGVGAPGINALVNALQGLPNTEVTVIAPAANQSGTGGNFTTTPISVAPAVTASGDPATAVNGFPADTVLYGVLTALPQRPHLVVSGINQGQNLGNVTELSGTVGAARTANRLGIPAIAISSGFGPVVKYGDAAITARIWVQFLRDVYVNGEAAAQTLNFNVPSCQTGSLRGLRSAPLGRTSDVGGYTLQSGSIGNGTFAPDVVSKNALSASNCLSTATEFDNDIDAFNNGFVTITALNPDFTDR